MFVSEARVPEAVQSMDSLVLNYALLHEARENPESVWSDSVPVTLIYFHLKMCEVVQRGFRGGQSAYLSKHT
ncbi:hypothetical protein T265_07433 [Opisthorchis viverrini]|uniref:Uncharacterized protein n=1 Tax=Opisthorchis viverrini TaxID=6198 RepID=A0A075ABL0_OPIVI|nr:hypothetical protein T265_07433 [Opisthorchis viverrini]KER25039.1 hypothetical protein T265_07433 [Opisthorchis viverrini]